MGGRKWPPFLTGSDSQAACGIGNLRTISELVATVNYISIDRGPFPETTHGLVVLPLSALHARGPYSLHNLLLGLLVHTVVIGSPVSYSVRRFAK